MVDLERSTTTAISMLALVIITLEDTPSDGHPVRAVCLTTIKCHIRKDTQRHADTMLFNLRIKKLVKLGYVCLEKQ